MYIQWLQHNPCVAEGLYNILCQSAHVCNEIIWGNSKIGNNSIEQKNLRSDVSDCHYIYILRCAHSVLSRDLFGSGHTGFLRGRTGSTEHRTITQSVFTQPSRRAPRTRFWKLMWFVTWQ